MCSGFKLASPLPPSETILTTTLPRTVCLALALALAAPTGCGSSGGSSSPDATPDAGTCSPPPDGSFAPYESIGTGTISGPDANAVLCYVGVVVYEEAGSGELLLHLDQMAPQGFADVHLPAGAVDWTLAGLIEVGAPPPGVSSNTSGQLCGALGFYYGLDLAPEHQCDAGLPPNCPEGCGATLCPDTPCCVPANSSFGYEATAATNCAEGGSVPVMGSWTLTLEGLVPYGGDAGAGQVLFTPHGTLTAILSGTEGTPGTTTLSLTF
jgi:hypothetical protein